MRTVKIVKAPHSRVAGPKDRESARRSQQRGRRAPLTRRMGVESSEVRARLVEAAGQIIREEGYAAVKAGRLAEMVGLNRCIVHYYFGTMEELFVAVIRRDGEEIGQRLRELLQSGEPLRVAWEPDNQFPALTLEFIAMAMRHKALQAEVRRFTEEFRKMHAEAIARHIKLRGIDSTVPPAAIAMVVLSISRMLSADTSLGVSYGHSETRQLVETWLRAFAQGNGPLLSG